MLSSLLSADYAAHPATDMVLAHKRTAVTRLDILGQIDRFQTGKLAIGSHRYDHRRDELEGKNDRTTNIAKPATTGARAP